MAVGITHEKAKDAHMKMLAMVLEQLVQQLTLTRGTCAAPEVSVILLQYTVPVFMILVYADTSLLTLSRLKILTFIFLTWCPKCLVWTFIFCEPFKGIPRLGISYLLNLLM